MAASETGCASFSARTIPLRVRLTITVVHCMRRGPLERLIPTRKVILTVRRTDWDRCRRMAGSGNSYPLISCRGATAVVESRTEAVHVDTMGTRAQPRRGSQWILQAPEEKHHESEVQDHRVYRDCHRSTANAEWQSAVTESKEAESERKRYPFK